MGSDKICIVGHKFGNKAASAICILHVTPTLNSIMQTSTPQCVYYSVLHAICALGESERPNPNVTHTSNLKCVRPEKSPNTNKDLFTQSVNSVALAKEASVCSVRIICPNPGLYSARKPHQNH